MIGGGATVVGLIGASVAGFVPGVSSLLGTARPRDLGVRYTEADYESGLAKIPDHTAINPEYMCFTCGYRSSGSVPADATFTQEEFTAQVNVLNAEKGPVSDAQVRFNDDGSVETSALVEYGPAKVPVYVKGAVADFGTRAVDMEITEADIEGVGLTGDQTQQATTLTNRFVRDFFQRNPGLSVEDLSVGSGGIDFKGTFPEEMEGDPNVIPESLS